MGQYFPTRVAVDAGFSATPAEVSQQTEQLSGTIQSDVLSLREQAEGLADEAKSIIQEVANFSPGNVRGVDFSTSTGDYDYVVPNFTPAPSVFQFDASSVGPLGLPPKLKISAFNRSSFTKPSSDPISFATLPERPANMNPPSAPLSSTITIPNPPSVNFQLQPLFNVGNPPAFSGSTGEIGFLDIDPIPGGDINLPGLGGLDQLEAAVNNKFERNPYNFKVLDSAMSASSALLSGNFIIDMDELEQGIVSNLNRALNRHHMSMTTLWSRRGFMPNGGALEYSSNVRDRVLDEHKRDFEAALERWRMRLLPVALQLSFEASAQMVEILGDLYDVDFEFLEAEHAALQSLFGLAAARFNIALSELERQAAEYEAETLSVRARADNHVQRAQLQRSIGRLNRARADGYSAQQQAAETQGDVFRTRVNAERTKAQAHDAQMDAISARARTLRARLLKYQGDVAAWGGDMAKIRAQYREKRAQNRAVVAQNRQVAAELSADVADKESVAFAARASAIDAVALSAKLRSDIAARMNDFVDVERSNAVSALSYAADVLEYRSELAAENTDLAKDRIKYRAVRQINPSVASSYNQISNSAVRAAQMTQQYRVQLANAYQSLYEAVGRADAARASGELSRYRASMALRTRGDIDYSSQVSGSASYSEDVSNNAANTRDIRYEPATF